MSRIFLSLGIGATLALSIANVSAKDKLSETFLKKAIEGNFAEVSMGDLKPLGAAKGLGMNPPAEPNAKQKADYDKMSKMSGSAFDKMFATHMIADHQKDIAEYMKASKIKDAAGEYASGEIDMLRKHLDAAKSLKPAKQ